jgi:hypothetical protein
VAIRHSCRAMARDAHDILHANMEQASRRGLRRRRSAYIDADMVTDSNDGLAASWPHRKGSRFCEAKGWRDGPNPALWRRSVALSTCYLGASGSRSRITRPCHIKTYRNSSKRCGSILTCRIWRSNSLSDGYEINRRSLLSMERDRSRPGALGPSADQDKDRRGSHRPAVTASLRDSPAGRGPAPKFYLPRGAGARCKAACLAPSLTGRRNVARFSVELCRLVRGANGFSARSLRTSLGACRRQPDHESLSPHQSFGATPPVDVHVGSVLRASAVGKCGFNRHREAVSSVSRTSSWMREGCSRNAHVSSL